MFAKAVANQDNTKLGKIKPRGSIIRDFGRTPCNPKIERRRLRIAVRLMLQIAVGRSKSKVVGICLASMNMLVEQAYSSNIGPGNIHVFNISLVQIKGL